MKIITLLGNNKLNFNNSNAKSINYYNMSFLKTKKKFFSLPYNYNPYFSDPSYIGLISEYLNLLD